ncbi:MAG: BON domain-containing protein [Thermoguttaceae bacterium]
MRRLIVGLVIAASAALVPTWAFAGNQEVAEQIAASLRDSGQLHGYRIGVKYNDGTVWLKGQVLSQEQKDAAVRLAKKANGVNVVNFDNLVVISGNAVAGSDRPLQQIDGALAAEQVQRLIAQDTRVASTERPAPEKLVDPLPPVPAEKQATVVPATDPTPAKHPGLAERLADSFPAQAVQQVKPTASPELASAALQESQPAPQTPVRVASPQPIPSPQTAGPVTGVASTVPSDQPIATAYTQVPNPAPNPALTPAPVPAANATPLPMAQPYSAQPAPAPMGAAPMAGGPLPMGSAPIRYDQPNLPNYAWPSYSPYPNYASTTYPKQYSPAAWPYIGPFYPYPQVPLGWRKVTLEWHDGWWFLDFDDGSSKGPFTGLFRGKSR